MVLALIAYALLLPFWALLLVGCLRLPLPGCGVSMIGSQYLPLCR